MTGSVMSIVVNTNIGSLNAQRSLAASSNELSTAMERLSSGKKINSASDDAAGFAIAEANDRTNPWLEHGDKKRERRLGYAFYD